MAKQHSVDMEAFTACMQDPQTILSQSLAKRNIQDFKIAIDMEGDPTKMDPETNISVFEMALKTHGCSEFVNECIRRGCKCDYINHQTKKTPISYATDSRDPKIMASILSVKNIPVNLKYSNLTPLNSLAKNIQPDNYINVFDCMKLLIQYGANPNIPDQREYTPILWIIKNKQLNDDNKKEIIKYLLENCELDLDTFRDGEARVLLTNKFPDLRLPEENIDSFSYEALISFIRNRNEDNFLKNYQNYINNNSNDNRNNAQQEENLKLLLEAIKNGQNRAFKIILNTMEIKESKRNLNITNPDKNPLQIACIWGNNEALKELLNDDRFIVSKTDCLLKSVIDKLDEKSYEDFTNYNACFYTLLNSNKIDINEVDPSGTSALYYAVKYKNEKAINELLQRGAYLGTKSQFGNISINGISPEILENYLDSCIKTNGLKPGDNLFEIVINYSNFRPIETEKQTNIVKSEMSPIEYIAETKELRHLLKHPVITSFLFLKWHRLSLVFYINFILYLLFCISLVTFIILKFNNTADEIIVNIFHILSFLGLVYMIIREILQFLISPQGFIRSTINLMEIALIILTIVTLTEPNYENETQRVLAVFTILLATLELCLLVGSLPVLSISTHMLMLRAVSETFLKCFGLYSMFVITFSISFYILFGKPGETDKTLTDPDNKNSIQNGKDKENDNEDGEFNKFANPFTAIIKTIVMLTGEFDAGDIEFNSFYSYFIFLLFVFFMSIVLFNLLNGLAVSDTHAIKKQAELNGSICRTIILSGYERALSGKDGRTSFIVNHEPFRSICKRLINIFPDFITGNQISILPNERNNIMIPMKNSIELGSIVKVNGTDAIPLNKTFLDYSEREKRVMDPPVKLLPCCCSFITNRCTQMDIRTVKTATCILDKKEKNKKSENRLQKIEENIEKILQLLQNKNY